jgi:hypothetical protein
VHLAVYYTFPAISPNSSIACGGRQS